MRRLNRAFVLKWRSLGTLTLWLSSENGMVTGQKRTKQRPIKCNRYKFAKKKIFWRFYSGYYLYLRKIHDKKNPIYKLSSESKRKSKCY